MTNLPAPVKRMQLSDLWRSDGVINRMPYVMWGMSLFGIKYGIDSFVAQMIFHQPWSIWSYFFPGGSLAYLITSSPEKAMYTALVTIALPFIWAGIVLTMRRLRAVGWPVWTSYLFFVPFVNLMLFAFLSSLPTVKSQGQLEAENNPAPPAIPSTPSEERQLPSTEVIPPLPNWPKPDRSVPSQTIVDTQSAQKTKDFSHALALTVPPAILITFLAIFTLQTYGWGLFLGLPFGLGAAAAFYYGKNEPKRLWDSVAVAFTAVTVLGVGLIFFAWEGVACMAMAAPIVYALAFMGAVVGYHMQKNPPTQVQKKTISIILLFFTPLLMGAENVAHVEPPMLAVNSTIEIAAPPAVVWNHVIAFPELEPPKASDWIFATGIAYPVGATISGTGPGAVRKCRFSTGAFVEPIKVWDAPKLLKFGVIAQPPTMREFTWTQQIHPAHLNGYLVVDSGQFKLEEVPDSNGGMSHTRIIGTTWYKNRMYPASYWQLWSNEIIHRIHLRVLNHIKQNAEKEMRLTS